MLGGCIACTPTLVLKRVQGALVAFSLMRPGQCCLFSLTRMSPEEVSILNPLGKKGLIFELETLATAIGVTQLLPLMAVRPWDRVVIF